MVDEQPGTPAFLTEEVSTPQPTLVLELSVSTTTIADLYRVQLTNDPSDYKVWIKLIEYVESQGVDEEVEKAFNECLAVFPEDDTLWCRYVQYFLDKDNRGKVEEIFKNCINMKSLPLWTLYLTKFVVKYNNLISGGRQALGNIIKAHEVLLVDVGLDLDADFLYDHEISIVNSFNAINEDQNLEKKKIVLQVLRKAIKMPTKKIQGYWHQYIEACPKSEIQINSADYLKLKSFVKQLMETTKGIDRKFQQSDKSINGKVVTQLALYRKWIEFERENKLQLPQDLLNKRIDYTYLLALRSLRFVPELWIDYSEFKKSVPLLATDKSDPSSKILQTALKSNVTSFALTFSLAESLECDGKTDVLKEAIENLITNLTKLYELNDLQIEKIVELQLEEMKRQESELKRKRKLEMEQNQNQNDDDDVVMDKGPKILNQNLVPKENYQLTSQMNKLSAEREKLGIATTLAYCNLMRFVKRNSPFSETRTIFKRGKKFKGHSWHIYSTSAQLEHENGNTKVGTKIYELAMKQTQFQKNIEFILAYLRFFSTINDKTNAKAIFETSVKNFESDSPDLKRLFTEYIKIENMAQDDIGAIKSLENRFMEKFPEVKLIRSMQERLKVVDFDPIKVFDYYDSSDKIENQYNGGGSKKRKIDQSSSTAESQMDVDSIEDGAEANSQEPFVQDEIYNLLRILPKLTYCQPSMFDEKSLVSFLRSLE